MHSPVINTTESVAQLKNRLYVYKLSSVIMVLHWCSFDISGGGEHNSVGFVVMLIICAK